jgi:hypothetical protein
MDRSKTSRNYEALLWSIALPGFGQFINKKFLKGLLFIFLEISINVMSNFNYAIVLSFLGNFQQAIEVTDYQWLMFYPCIYFYSLWDAYRDANDCKDPYLYLPFAFCVYFVTLGLIYSTEIKINGMILGPVFLPMIFVIPGLILGFFIRSIALRRLKENVIV